MNPLLARDFPVPFDRIRAEHIEPGIREAIDRAEVDLRALVDHPEPRTYENTLQALDDLVERVRRPVTVAGHLNAVMSSPEIRAGFNAVVPLYSGFFARLSTDGGLWNALKAFAATPEAAALTGVRRRHLDKTLREFQRSGADLDPDRKLRFREIQVELSRLQTTFGQNVLDATNSFELIVGDPADLAGLPPHALAQARAGAAARGKEGFRFTLQAPSYLPMMQFVENRALRERLYRAFQQRATVGDLDNRPLLRRILQLRRELASLLGFADFADYRLELNMVGSGREAVAFERGLYERTRPFWRREIDALAAFARQQLQIPRLEPWDVAFASERLRRERFAFDSEDLRPYFPLDRVFSGLFELSRRLFGVEVRRREGVPTWHPEVETFDVLDEDGTLLGSFYADLFPRESKRAGAWKLGFVVGGPAEDAFDPHLVLIAANFPPPQGDSPALLNHREVQTVFHEFGHLLHHCLSRVDVRARGATQVPRDWVELPSQILENWTWEREALDLFARHHLTGESIPEDLYQRLVRSRTFMEATAQMRQLSFGSVDLALHIDYDPEGEESPMEFGNRVMEAFVPRPDFAHNGFLASFSHVFDGGYAAGYYSYKWSEVLDADAFSRFRREGLFDRATGKAFVDTVLSRGDSADPAVLFREFMGRDPDMGALLERTLGPDEPIPAGR